MGENHPFRNSSFMKIETDAFRSITEEVEFRNMRGGLYFTGNLKGVFLRSLLGKIEVSLAARWV